MKLLVALVSCLALHACDTFDKRSDTARPKVRVAFSPVLSWGPIMIARAEGYFDAEGIEVEYVPSLGSEEELAALVTGDIDVDPGPLHAGFLSAIAQGAKTKIVAGQGFLDRGGCTYYGIVRRKTLDSAARDIKRIRSSQDGVTRFATMSMLRKHGINLNNLETMRLPDAVLAMSLESGAIDAVGSSEPALSRLRKIGPLWLSAQNALPDLQWGVIAFSERLLYREKETGAKFLRAYSRGVEQYRQGKTERNVAIIAEATGESADTIREACWLPFRADLVLDWKSVDDFQKWANEEGLMEKTLSVDQAWDSTFLAQAMSQAPQTLK